VGQTFGAVHLFTHFLGHSIMEKHLKSYAWFVGFLVITKIVVAPIAKQMNIPLVSDALQ
jgi:hypothetical protein